MDKSARLAPNLAAAAAAFLMFEGELMAGKEILPQFGGSAFVWYSVILFFQLLVIAGYYGSRHLLELSPHGRRILLAALGASGLLTLLRWQPEISWLPAEVQPLLALLPFAGAGAALFCVTPLLHRQNGFGTNYSIYAWSNGGALLGLLAYPFLIEPNAGLVLQNRVWAAGVLLISVIGPGLGARNIIDVEQRPSGGMGKTRWQWWALPAISSATLLATTNQLSYQASPGPLAWALVLAMYLATYVWAFSGDRRAAVGSIAVLGLVAMVCLHMLIVPRSKTLLTLLLTAGGACMAVCHAWLASTKNSNSHGFYSATAIGGALGSALMVLVVPRVTNSPVEFPVLILSALAVGGFALGGRIARPLVATMAVVAIGGTIVAESSGRIGELARVRTLYGCLRVTRSADGQVYKLINNLTFHGEEDHRHLNSGWTYYGRDSGIGRLILSHETNSPAISVGVIGLGAGTINRLLRDSDNITYYEINAMDEALARKYFTYLRRPPDTHVFIGDGRKLLERDRGRKYDVLVIDAFNGDAIPMHLLTREAGELYRARLRPGGGLAVHITNAYVDLRPVVRGLAKNMGMRLKFYLTQVSAWAVLTPGAPEEDGQVVEWTDDKSSLLPVLKNPAWRAPVR